MHGAPPEGLRERKKRATRDAIAASARRLFAERGFDAVTVAEVAAAADVSEKTVFNHFATKEDLAFAGGEARLDQLLADIAQRPAGTSVLDVFRASSEAMIDTVAAATEGDDRPRRPPRSCAAAARCRSGSTAGGSTRPPRSPPRSPRPPARTTTTSSPRSSPARWPGRISRSSAPRSTALLAGEDPERAGRPPAAPRPRAPTTSSRRAWATTARRTGPPHGRRRRLLRQVLREPEQVVRVVGELDLAAADSCRRSTRAASRRARPACS